MFEVIEDLEALRKAAKISQEEMAGRLGVSQSAVSRYEQNPDDVPMGVLKKWAAICGNLTVSDGLSVGEPYNDIEGRIRLIQDYTETEPTIGDVEIFTAAPRAADFVARVKAEGRKPRVGVFGYFDQGKSRLLNTIMASNSLPTGYQPATSIICLIKHRNDRPTFIREDVWIMDRGFDFNRADDEAHCVKHRLYAGGYETLKRYGTHSSAPEDENCQAALVFVESDLLLGCDLIDSPGFGHSDQDHQKVEFAKPLVDILIYTSTAQGFLNRPDFVAISGLIKQLPVVGRDDGLAPLSNMYFVATMANMSPAEREGLLENSSRRAFAHFQETLELRQGGPLAYPDFASRFFTFRVEDPLCRKRFEDDLTQKLSVAYPRMIRARLDQSVMSLKAGAKNYWETWSGRLSDALQHKDRAQAALAEHRRLEPARQRRLGAKKERVLTMIADNKEDTRHLIDHNLSQILSPEHIEKVIVDRYGDDKKEAQSLACIYMNDTVQNELNQFLALRATGLVTEVNEILKEYEMAGQVVGGMEAGSVSIPFNAQGVFIGALTAAGAAGALATWAAIATAGSNLGAYLLIPTVVSFLSSLGISVGGTASAVSLVAAIGGPITVLIGVSVLAGILGYTLFKPNWKTQLARKIADTFREKEFLERLTENSDKYWDDTRRSFLEAIESTEQTFLDYVRNLDHLANATSRTRIEELIRLVGEARDFFGGIPWKSAK